MGFKETWSAVLQLYRKSISQTWYLGVMIGIAAVISSLTNTIYKTSEGTAKIISIVVPLTISLVSVYLTSLVFLRISNVSKGQNMPFANSLTLVNKRYFKVVAAMLIVILINMLGIAALLLPGIFAFVLFSMTQPLVLLDDHGIIDSLKTSCKLIWGNWWRTFAIMFPLMIPNYWIHFSISYAVTYNKWNLVITSALVAMLFYPLLYSCILVVYNNLRSRVN